MIFILLGFNFSSLLFAQKDIDDIKKSAERSFNDENYVEAYKLYAQLVANFSKEPMYNYRLGVSMIYAESDKKKCIPYLEFAVKFVQKKEVPPEALFYLGKAYHINYRFDEAIRYYREYKQQVSSSRAKEMEVDKEIAACENGKKLLSNIKELVVLSKKRLNENEYFKSYDLSTIGGKLLVKPDEFQTKYDKKKKDKSIVYLPQTGDKVFFSSYGEDGKNGRDIYYAIRLPNGTFAKPQPLTAVNTPYDEDYPFLHPNGKVLYFASKGHKGMGGYDIFKSTYDPASQTWSSPENLEFPINSPGDDFLFVTDSSEKIAFFSTSRYAPPGQIDVLKIKTERVPPLFVAIKGNVRKTEINQSVRSVITVKNIETGDLVGTFTADENGQYYMELPNGGKFLFTVETPGFTKQSEAVNLPLSYAIKPLRQSISYEKNVLVITNYFDEASNENAYLDIVEFIEKKAQLDVNESQFKQTISPPVAKNKTSSNNPNQNETNTKPSHQEKQELSASNTPIPPNNTQELLAIVKKDAEESQLEAQQLESENAQLKQVIQLKEQEVKDIDKSIADTQNQLNNADTKEEKEQLTQLLNELQNKKGAAEEQVKFFQQYQKEVEAKLINKKKEADLNQQFVNALQELETGKNKNLALKKLEQLQKDLQALEQTNTEQTTALSTLNQQEKEKQQEIYRLEKQKSNEEKDIQLLKEELSNLKNELATTKDKSLKENIQSQINERENELKEKENKILALSSKIQEEKEDLQSIQEQKQIIAKIKNKEEIPITSKNNTTEPPTQNIITNANINQVNNDYTTKINSAKNDEEKKKYLEEYSQLLMKSIEENNKKTSATSDLSQKQKLQNLNSELELLLKENNDKLVAIQNKQTELANKNENKSNQIPSNNNANNLNQQTDVAVKNENKYNQIPPNKNANNLNQQTDVAVKNENKSNQIPPNNNANNLNQQTDVAVKNENKSNQITPNNNANNLNQQTNVAVKNESKSNQIPPNNNANNLNQQTDVAVKNENKSNQISSNNNANNLNQQTDVAVKNESKTNQIPSNNNANNLNQQTDVAVKNENKSNQISSNNNANSLNQQTDVVVKNENKSNQITPNNNANNLNQQTDVAVKNENELLPIINQQEIINTIAQNDQIKSEFTTLKKQFVNQSYQSPSSASLKENIPQISESNETSKTIINIINANNQSYSFAKQADSLRKLASDLKAKANKTTDNNQKQKLLADAKKLDVAALEKEYQSTQFKKTYHQNLFQYYENAINQLPEEQKQKIIPELTKAKQNFQQAEKLRKEASTQPNLTVKLAAEQNAQEKEQLAITNINRLFKENNIQQSPESVITSIQQETQKVEQNYLQLQNQYIKANSTEINYLIQQLNTAQKIKNDATLSSSLNQLKEIYKNIESQISSNPSKENNNTIINNQLQLLQQLRQLATTIHPIATTKNDYLTKETTNKIIASNNLPKDTILSIAQKLPLNIDNSYSKQIQTLIQDQKQIEDNLKTENPILKTSEEIQKTNEQLNTEITQLTNKALELKQKIAQTTDQRKKAEIQTEFERTNAQIQEKKIQQVTNELLLNQAQFAVQQNYLNQLINSIPSNKSNEKNVAQSTLNEIQKLKKQEEDLIKEALQLTNPSAQLGALQNARIKQQEYIQQQIELEKKLAIYNPNLKKQSPSININDPLALTLQYQNNIQKQIKEWEAVNNNLNLEITRLYPKYSNTPSGKLLADAQKLISESKTTTDLNKKLELQIKAAQLQQQAMQQLSSGNIPVAQTNTNQNPPGIAKQNQISTTPQNSVAINNIPKEKNNNALTQNTTTATSIPKEKSTNAPLQNTVAVTNNQKEKTTNTPTQNTIAANNKTPNKTTATPPNTTPTITSNVKKEEITNNFLPQIKSVKIARTPAYSDAKPIPLNPPLPDGLIFSVQVGAFKNPLPNNFFNGLNPIFAQTTENNLYRYLVGQMTDPQEAIALKNNFRNLGYTDAFVIAYYKGKRISLSEALDILKKEKQIEPKINPFATTNVLEKANIPTYTTLLATTQQENITTPQTPSIREAEEINDLYFTIQIGVYGKDVSDATFKYIKPIIRSNIDNKFYRYSAGIYDNLKQAKNDLNKVIALGMKDAFICAYWNGKRIFYPEAEKLIRENKNIRYAPAQPIQFPNEAAAINLTPNPTAQNAIIETSPNSPPFDPTLVFSNGVTKRPEPTPENGVKADNSGICFRVQIGAFKNKVPPSTAEKYFKIKDWPIEVHYINGLYIYTVGNFVSAKYAAKLREQVVSYGITDAFITVYKDNKKLFGYEALKYMNQQ
ncbi:MAG: hypothetical protein N3F62_10145 [Bacteroidia bacterium]|nr:hypothetical protein [Bacteroidia bacterium]